MGRRFLGAAASGSTDLVTKNDVLGLPQGRLSLASNNPGLLLTTVTSAILYFTPLFTGATIPLWNGALFIPTKFSELQNTFSDATKNPAAIAALSNYDLFVWNDAGTLRLSRSPAWTSNTVRSLALSTVGGIGVNAAAITNGPAAGYGTWVGSFRAVGTTTQTWNTSNSFAAIGASQCLMNVWNAYNRLLTPFQITSTIASGSSRPYATNGYNYYGATGQNIYALMLIGSAAAEPIDMVCRTKFAAAVGVTYSLAWALGSSPIGTGSTDVNGAGATILVSVEHTRKVVPQLGVNFPNVQESSPTAGSVNVRDGFFIQEGAVYL